jgi:FAD/FMN-containing dehydrogenase
VDLVTADGTILRADHEQNAELFWALRGGGGNFGVATSFTYQLPVLDHPVLAGTIEYKVDIVPFLRFVREFLADCPDRLELTAVIRVEDDGPRGAIRVCWTGDPSTGEEVLRPLREFLPPVLDAIQLQPYGTFSALVGPDENILPRGGEFAELSDDVINAVAGIFEPRPPQRCLIRIGHLMHGALLQVPFDDTPMIREPGHLFYHVAGYWEDDEDSTDPRAWLDASHEALKPVNASRIYVNYLSNPDQASVRATYGPHYSRLQAVKRQYDPENFFHNNRNIVP